MRLNNKSFDHNDEEIINTAKLMLLRAQAEKFEKDITTKEDDRNNNLLINVVFTQKIQKYCFYN